MELTLDLNAASNEALHTQVFDQIRSLILGGRLRPGMPLPSSRALAEQLFISRNTVILGYERLAGEGYIESRGTAGTYVSSLLPDDLVRVSRSEHVHEINDEATPEPVLCFAGSPGGDGASSRPEIDFWVGRSAAESFPLRIWRKLLTRALNSPDIHLADYCDPVGLLELRQSIVSLLARSRGMAVEASQVVITGGSQDGLNFVHRLVAGRYKKIFVENPCYQGAALLFQSLGNEVIPIPVDDSGLKIDALPSTQSSLVFVTPSHQFPSGVTLTLKRRVQLLKWAEATDSLIIEDDYDSDFRYDGPPLTALAGLDNSHRVFYLGTFSKSLGAGLRLGYTVVPQSFTSDTRLVKAFMNNGQPWLDQVVLTEFLQSGEFERHIRRVRKTYKERRDQLVQSLEHYFPETTISGAGCGLHLVWRLPSDFPDATSIQRRARELGIGIYSLRSGAALDFNKDSPDNIILLGYSSVTTENISRAVVMLRGLIDTMCQELKTAAKNASNGKAPEQGSKVRASNKAQNSR